MLLQTVKQQSTSKNTMNIENVTFGVELETTIPLSAQVRVGAYHHGAPITSAVTTLGMTVTAPTFEGHAWKGERDGSIVARAPMTACEFVSPVLRGEAGVLHLVEFISFLNSIGAQVNSSCGMHVHVGLSAAGDSDEARLHFVKILSRLVSRKSTALYAQTGTVNRELGHYCAPAATEDRRAVIAAGRSKNLQRAGANVTRYKLLNLANLTSRGTVEFRCFAGTTNAHKVLLHLFSVFTFCRQAAERKGLLSWADAREQFTGEKMVKNLLRPSNFKALFPVFSNYRATIVATGLKMARKYDAEKAARLAANARPVAPIPMTAATLAVAQ